MPFLDECEEYFGSRDLYVIIGVQKKASASDIKKAYRKMSLKTHPDRVPESGKILATEKFKILGKVYNILSDPDRRTDYDETGAVDDELNDKIVNWNQFWSSVFPGLTEQRVDEYFTNYWGSKEEESDLKAAYLKYEGDMNQIFQVMSCRVLEHEPRFTQLIQGWIDSGEVPAFRAFTHETKRRKLARKRKYEKEERECEKNMATFEREMGDSMSSLQQMIAQRREEREKKQKEFLDNLAAKYVKPRKTKAKSGNAGTSKRAKESKKK